MRRRNSRYTKLVATFACLVLALSLMVVSSYAWMSMSSSPAVEGLQVTIGGGNTILVAPDVTETVNGVTYHYPGSFSGELNFSQTEYYEELSNLGGLTPVSTADGVTWYLPVYSEDTGEIDSYTAETNLAHANVSADQGETIAEGHYIYLDFWIVSPTDGYTIRVSSGGETDGSYVLALRDVAETEEGWTLESGDDQSSATARLGFLVDETAVEDDNSMYLYMQSADYSSDYSSLAGVYEENSDDTAFTIYEPNADLHPDSNLSGIEDGAYALTLPVTGEDGTTAAANAMSAIVTAQLSGSFNSTFGEIFKAAVYGREFASAEEVQSYFYGDYLQNQLSAYVQRGRFLSYSESLFTNAVTGGGTVSAADMSGLLLGGATEDVSIVTLQRDVPQRVRMFVWLEGQDADCVGGSAGSSLSVFVQLAGASEE
ncbi:MAG: hypothetical protein LUC32_00195 [Clostridiales bacterium]|nr:hypothetical protein [Clostridiales bacterium]